MKINPGFMAALLLMSFGASAQGLIANDEPTCYSWNGGNYSAGSFNKCGPRWVAPAKPAPKVVATPVASPQIAPSPIMMPQVSCAPPPKPLVKPKRKPPVKC